MTELRSEDPARDPRLAMLLCAMLGVGFAVALGHLDVFSRFVLWAVTHLLQLLVDAIVETPSEAFLTPVLHP